jgi:hypothetical protein
MTWAEPHLLRRLGFCLGGLASTTGGVRDQDRKSELLSATRLNLATMTGCGLLLQARQSGMVGWVVCGLPWEVGVAGCFATMLDNDDSWYCVLCRVVWVG